VKNNLSPKEKEEKMDIQEWLMNQLYKNKA